jgi:hypothetical protein
MGDLTSVIANQRVGAQRRPMTGSAKQSIGSFDLCCGSRRFACNDDVGDATS